MQMINVNAQILKFRKFLLDAWNNLDNLMEDHDWDDDGRFTEEWLQVNWEFLVERQLLKNTGFLSPYEGLLPSFRVTHPDQTATSLILCCPKNGDFFIDDKTKNMIKNEKNLIFQGFVNKKNAGYGCYPPFDYVTVFTSDGKKFYHFPLDDVNFFLSPISKD